MVSAGRKRKEHASKRKERRAAAVPVDPEHRTLNPQVLGSNPRGRTKKDRAFVDRQATNGGTPGAVLVNPSDPDLLDALRRRRPRTTSHRTVVYFIEDEHGRIKIGMTRSVESRLRGLQTATADRLVVLATIPGGIVEEREMHTRLAAHRIAGEWFAGPPVRAMLASLGLLESA
jgi:hypothetical protein